MNLRLHLRNALLLLAAGSVVYVGVQEFPPGRAPSLDKVSAAPGVGPGTKLVVYYFSQGKNCSTCEQIPLFTREVLDASFAPELASGEIAWVVINVDDPVHEHFVGEYGLYTKAVVLSRLKDGLQTRWKNLEKVWDLVYDHDAFLEYVRTEVRASLDAAP